MSKEDGKQASSFEGKETRGSVVLSIAFFAAFTAYMAIQNLQSSLNQAEDLGIISLSVLYACIIFSGILAPAVIKFLGVKKSLILSWICHILYTGSNFYPTFYTLIPSSILLGAISGFMWTGQSIYISVCAFSLAKSSGKTEYDVLSKLNGLFFTMFETTQITGNLVSSLILQTGTYSNVTEGAVCGPNYCPLAANGSEIATPELSVVYTLLGIYLGCDVIALVVTMFFLPPLPKSNWSSNASLKQSLSSFFVTLFKSKLMFLVPFIMFQAVEQAILWGDYTRSYVSCTIGIHMVGFIMATYGAATASFAFVFSRFAKYIGRYILFFTAAVLQGGVFIVLYIWTPTSEDLTYLFLIPVAWGLGESIWQTQSNSLIALLFPEKKEPAFANFHTWKAIGFTLTFILSNFLCLKTKLIFVMTLLVAAMTMYTGVEVYTRRSHGSDVTKPDNKIEDKKVPQTSL